MSTDAGSNYNVTKTTTFFEAYHFENDSETGLTYQSTLDLAQSTDFQSVTNAIGMRMLAAKIARGEDNYMTSMFERQEDFE